ncbi:MAG: hypothetical protein AAGF45_11695 [Pseudomonadota bacterium]
MREVLAGPGGGAEPTVFVDDEDVLTMTVGLIDTPGGLGMFDHAIYFCPFCGRELQAAELSKKAPH